MRKAEPAGTEISIVKKAEPAGTEISIVKKAEPAGTEISIVRKKEPAGTEISTVRKAEPAGRTSTGKRAKAVGRNLLGMIRESGKRGVESHFLFRKGKNNRLLENQM